jgi:chromosome segregation ATPase
MSSLSSSSSSSSRPVPQISTGRLVSLTVDNPKYYTTSSRSNNEEQMPPLIPTAAATASGTDNHNAEEQTMIWKNIATLFMKMEQTEETFHGDIANLTRGSDEMYQELQDVRAEVTQVHDKLNDSNLLSSRVRKLRKYVNKKCEKVQSDLSYGAYSSIDEVFAYVNTLRDEYKAKIENLENENAKLHEKMENLHRTYDDDYQLFIRRENVLMEKLDAAVHTTDGLSNRLKDHEAVMMRHIGELHNCIEQRLHHVAGDLREEFAHAITRELKFESKTSAQLVQSVNDELTELITRSNQYHSHRYFGMVEDVKQVREMCDTLKQSIGMVDAELSDTKETVEFLKDEVGQASNDIYDIKEDMNDMNTETSDMKNDVYRELDRDYYDLKDYVKRQFQRHKNRDHDNRSQESAVVEDGRNDNGIQMIVNGYQDPAENENVAVALAAAPAVAEEQRDEHVIIIDATTIFSEGDDDDDYSNSVTQT